MYGSREMSRPRVLLADDHTLLLEAFQKMLAADCDVVGAVTNGHDLVSAALRLRPDVVVLDIAMPLLNGVDAARRVKHELPDVQIVVLTMNEDPELAAEAFRAGASAYLLKRSAGPELLTAIHEVVSGRYYMTPLVTAGVVGTMLQNALRPATVQPLTPRQREIVQLVAEGHSLKEVGSILRISPRTVAFHKARIMEQLQIRTTAELIRYALANHIVQ
jgi:DNA-binding NarL/FixJ family response regulator